MKAGHATNISLRVLESEGFRQKVINTLKHYANGARLEEDHREIIDHYKTLGIVRCGYSFTKREEQASLTEIGKAIIGL